MKNKILFLLLFFPIIGFSQVKGKINFDAPIRNGELFIDPYNNIYIVKNNLIIEKHDSTGKLMATYSAKRNGKISNVDFSNPLRILVYYRLNQQIIFLDNTLSEIGNYLLKNDYGRTKVVANGSENSIIYFDTNRQKLIRENLQSGIKNESDNLSQVFGKNISSAQLFERNQEIFLLDTLYGLLEFDFYCKFNRNHGNYGFTKVQVMNDLLIGRKGTDLLFIDLKNKNQVQSKTLGQLELLDCYYSAQGIFMLTKKAVFLQAEK